MMPRKMRWPTPRLTAVAPLVAAGLVLAACSEPSPPVTASPGSSTPAGKTLDAAQIFAVVYRCKDGSVFTTWPRGESASSDKGTASPQSPTAVADCEGTEARTPAEAEQLRIEAAAAAAAAPPAG